MIEFILSALLVPLIMTLFFWFKGDDIKEWYEKRRKRKEANGSNWEDIEYTYLGDMRTMW